MPDVYNVKKLRRILRWDWVYYDKNMRILWDSDCDATEIMMTLSLWWDWDYEASKILLRLRLGCDWNYYDTDIKWDFNETEIMTRLRL